jgi:GNAT superfamily N-acetyltransferase
MRETRELVVRPVGEDERAAWDPLWDGYLTFYKTVLPHNVSDVTWQRLHDPAEPIFILGAYADDKLTGFAHYLFHRSTWAPNWYCYLEDLFVADGARGLGAGRALIEAVCEKARLAGANRVYWLTHETNAQARLLYDKVADKHGYIQYRRMI